MNCDLPSTMAIRSFCESVSSSSTTNLELLRAIDDTVDMLSSIEKVAHANCSLAIELKNAIASCKPAKPIDPDGAFRVLSIACEDLITSVKEKLDYKKASACSDTELRSDSDNLDTVVTQYDAAIAAFCNLHDAMAGLRWQILEHDADLETPVEDQAFLAEGLIKRLRA